MSSESGPGDGFRVPKEAEGHERTDKLGQSTEQKRRLPLDVVVRGMPRVRLGTVVTVQRAEDLERTGAESVADALDRTSFAGATRNERGETIFWIRGFGQRQVPVLVDGVPAAVAYDGRIDLGKFPVGMVERVVVVKGAGSLLYGPNGLGGVVNIVTRRPGSRPWIAVQTELAPPRSMRQSATISARSGTVAALVGATYSRRLSYPLSSDFVPAPNEDGGERNASDRMSVHGLGKFAWDVSPNHQLQLSLSGLKGAFGVPPGAFDLSPRYWRWNDWSTHTVSLTHRWSSRRIRIAETAYVSLARNVLDSYDDATYSSQSTQRAFTSTYRDVTAGGYVRGVARGLWKGKGGGKLDGSFWVGVQRDRHLATGMGEPVEAADTLATAALQADWRPAVQWAATPGIQFDVQVPDSGPAGKTPDVAWSLSPMLTVSRRVLPTLWLTFSGASRSRFPTLRERYSEVFGGRVPNPGLSAEHALQGAVDLSWQASPGVRLSAGVFDAEVSDLIELVPVGQGREQLRNVGTARFAGAEFRAKVAPVSAMSFHLGASWLSAVRTDEYVASSHVSYRPSYKLLAVATLKPLQALELSAVERIVGAQWFQNPDTLRWETLDPSARTDAKALWHCGPGVDVWFRISNLLDANVWSKYGYPDPGREWMLGLRVREGNRTGW